MIDLGVLVEGPDGCLILPEPLKLLGTPRIDEGARPAGETLARSRSPQRAPSAATVEPPGRLDSGAEDWARELAEFEAAKPAPAPAKPVPVDPEAEIARQAMRVARARVVIRQLQDRLARPGLAAYMLPFGPIDVPGPGRCAGCQRLLDVDQRRGHVGEAIAKKRLRCAWWGLTGEDGTP